MYNLNELAFEAMLENVKQAYRGNPFMKLAVDKLSYEYNRTQYNDCLHCINEENNQISNIYNRISRRGGFVSPSELQELQRHVQKSMKHLLSGGNDAENIINKFI